jgi:uncharacterized protein with ParB-like and HNH nuclease domain
MDELKLYKDSEVGIEDDTEIDILDDPFNPEEISIDSRVISMDNCLRRLVQNTIILNPDFQRKEVWTNDKKSQLIESLMLKIPLPMFYVSADEKNNYTVVDGLQRLSTIRSFILGDKYLETQDPSLRGNGFKLQDLEFWGIYNGRNFNELPPNIQNRILETEFSFTIINPGTPEEVRRNIFKRINTGGLPLSSHEIRNALYIGKSTKLLTKLANLPCFKTATADSIKSIRMEDKELILRFLAFLVRDYSTYKRTVNVDSFLSDTMIIINSMPNFDNREFKKLIARTNIPLEDIRIKNIDKIVDYFEKAMTRSYQLFGSHTFRKSYGNYQRTPINKALFETWGVLLAMLSEDEFKQLLAQKEAFLAAYTPFLHDNAFNLIISRDSMKHPSVKYRFEKLNQIIQQFTAHD